MKKLFFIFTLISFLIVINTFAAFTKEDLEKEVKEGEEIYQKLTEGELKCQDLNNEKFAALGEYLMDLMVGNRESHLAMNIMMKNMHGEEGEKLMHINMGKRFSGCNDEVILIGKNYQQPLRDLMMKNNIYEDFNMPMPMSMRGNSMFDNRYGFSFLNTIPNWFFGVLSIFWFIFMILLPVLTLVFLFLMIIYFIKKIRDKNKSV